MHQSVPHLGSNVLLFFADGIGVDAKPVP